MATRGRLGGWFLVLIIAGLAWIIGRNEPPSNAAREFGLPAAPSVAVTERPLWDPQPASTPVETLEPPISEFDKAEPKTIEPASASIYTIPRARLREAPNAKTKVLATLPAGSSLEAGGLRGKWQLVKGQGYQG